MITFFWIIPSSRSPRWWSWIDRSPQSSPRAKCPSWETHQRKVPKFSANKTVKPRCIWVWNLGKPKELWLIIMVCMEKNAMAKTGSVLFSDGKKHTTVIFMPPRRKGGGSSRLAAMRMFSGLGYGHLGMETDGVHPPMNHWPIGPLAHWPIGPLAHWPGIAGIEDGLWWVLPPQKAWQSSVMTRRSLEFTT